MRMLKQSGTRPVFFLLVLTSDHITGATGLTPTVTISKDGAAFATPAGTVAEIANGWYKLTPTSADTGSLGALLLHATGTGADPVDHIYQVVAYDPESATSLGLSNLDAAITSRMATYTQPTGFLASTFPTTVASPTNITAASGVVLSGVTHTGAVIPTVTTTTTATNVTNDVGITQAAADKAWSTTTRVLTAGTNIALAKGTGLTGLNDITAAAASTAVWDELTATGRTAGSYGALVKLDLDATVSSRSTYAGGAVASVTAGVTVTTNNDKTGYGLSAAAVQAIWDALTSALTTVGSIGKLLVTNIDATISSRSTYAGADTAGTTTLLTRVGTPAVSVSADVAAVKAVLPSALVSGRIDASVGAMAAGVQTTASFAVGAIDNTVLSSNAEQAIADKTLATVVDGTITLRQLLQLIGASAVGKLSGAATTTVTIRNVSDTVNAVVATVDADGNRSATTYTVT